MPTTAYRPPSDSPLVARHGDVEAASPLLLTCEHAGNLVPPPARPSAEDRRWLETHWGYDLGAAAVAFELARRTGSPLCLANFSRLLCDTNRPWGDPTCIRPSVEGHPLSINRDLDEPELARRQATLYHAYHGLVDQSLAARARLDVPVLLFAVHSFTPRLGAEQRPMELGVLYDDYQPLAEKLAEGLTTAGFVTALNEPYSGKQGMIYSAATHGRRHGVCYLEIEVRQDLVVTEAQVEALVERLLGPLRGVVGELARTPTISG